MARIAKEAEERGDHGLAGTMYKKLAQYVAPKRRSLQHSGDLAVAQAHEMTDLERSKRIEALLDKARTRRDSAVALDAPAETAVATIANSEGAL